MKPQPRSNATSRRLLALIAALVALTALGSGLATSASAATASPGYGYTLVGVYTIKNLDSSNCLDSNYPGGNHPNNGQAYTDGCNGGTYQQWKKWLISNGDGYYQFQDVQTGYCLDSDDNSNAYTSPCNNENYYQDWTIQAGFISDVQTSYSLMGNPQLGGDTEPVFADAPSTGDQEGLQWTFANAS